MKRTLFVLAVFALVAMLVVGCNPSPETTDDDQDQGEEIPGGDNPGTGEENPDVTLPEGAPELSGTLEEFEALSGNFPGAPDAPQLLVTLLRYCMLIEYEDYINGNKVATELVFTGKPCDYSEIEVAFWGTVGLQLDGFSFDGRLSMSTPSVQFVFDIEGQASETEGTISVNGGKEIEFIPYQMD